jgi:hypothetical protein
MKEADRLCSGDNFFSLEHTEVTTEQPLRPPP